MPSQSLYDHPAVPMRIRGATPGWLESAFAGRFASEDAINSKTNPERSTGTGDERNLVGHYANVKNAWGMPKNGLLAVLLCVACFPLIVFGGDESPDAATIRSAEMKIAEAYKSRQVDSFASLLDDDFVITFEDGSVYGKTGYLSYSASASTRIEVAELSDMKIRLHGETAVVTGMYHEKGMDNRNAYDYHDHFTDVWMKKAGKWRMIAAHYSVPSK